MNKDVSVYLEDIVSAIEKIESFVLQMSYAEFSADDKTQFAVVRAMEIIGEAVKHVPDSIRIIYPSVPWKEMAGMRDILIHDYGSTDISIIWKTVTENMYSVKNDIATILGELEKKK